MKRFIVVQKMISKEKIIEVEHSIAYETLEAAAKEQLVHMNISEYTIVGFRIVELEELKK